LLFVEALYALFDVPIPHFFLVSLVLLGGALCLVPVFKNASDVLRIIQGISELATDGVVITDKHNKIVYANPAVMDTYGYSFEELFGKTPSLFKSGIQDAAFYRAMWKSIREKGSWTGEIWDVKKNGDYILKNMRIETIKNSKGKVRYYLAVHRDLTEMQALQSEKELLINYDQDTQLPNKRYLLKRMQSLIDDQVPFQLVLSKVRNSVHLSDKHSQKQYTETFKELEKRLKKTVSASFYAQVDSEFFAVILHKRIKNEEAFHEQVQSVVDACEEPFTNALRFKMTAGALRFPEDGDEAKDLFNKAMVTFEISAAEGNRYLLYNHRFHKKLSWEYNVRDALYEAVQRTEFSLRYQPIVEFETGAIVGCEALIRWTSKTLGAVPPDSFLPIAEKYGFMTDIGAFIYETGFQDKRIFDQVSNRTLHMSVNASVHQFAEKDFADTFLRIVRDHDLPPQEVCLELTESSFVSDYNRLNKDLHALRKAGVRVAIDDFGTGYSSLKRLQTMEADVLKIDRTFLAGYPETSDGNLLKAMVQIGKSSEFSVIVEGVETKAQHDLLEKSGCDAAQGYYYAKPLSKDEFVSALKNS